METLVGLVQRAVTHGITLSGTIFRVGRTAVQLVVRIVFATETPR